MSATPTARWSCSVTMRWATWTPTSASGAEPASIQSARCTWTVPSIRCRTAPKDLKIAPWRMSVPTATLASKLKSRIRIGVISEPPPMPVMPTSTPTSSPASENSQVTRAPRSAGETSRSPQTPSAGPLARTGGPAAGDGAGDERFPRHPAEHLVRLTAGAEPGRGGEQRESRDEQAERRAGDRPAGRVGERGGGEHDEPDDVRRARRPRVLELALAQARLDGLEVGETRQAPAPAEGQAERKLEREQREQDPPAGRDGEDRHEADHRLVEPRRPRVDHGGVAVRIGEAGAQASSTIPAATVSFVVSSMRMNAPVARVRVYMSTASGSARRSFTTPRPFSSSRPGAG